MLLPIAVALGASAKGASVAVRRPAVAASAGLGLCVLAYSWLQVRSGRWSHVDASAPRERGQLNPFLALLLLAAVGAALWLGWPRLVAGGMAAAAALVIFAHAARRFLKVSLHSAFGVFAALLALPNIAAMTILLAVSGFVAWSRVALARHNTGEAVAGVLAGATAGVAFQLLSR